MYRRVNDGDGQVLAYRLSGKLTEGEVEEMKREVASAMEEHGKVRMLCEMGDFSGADPAAIWEDLKFTPRYVQDLEKFAIVGDKRWHEWVAKLSDNLTTGEAEFFEPTHLDEAWDWIQH